MTQPIPPVLSQRTLNSIAAEAIRAHTKHGDNSLVNPDMPVVLKLAALMEEVGEVARELTYDHRQDHHAITKLRRELIQVASVAASWVESLPYE